MRYLFLVIYSLLFNVSLPAQKDSSNYKEALRIVDIWLDAQRDFDRLPGISVAVVHDQNILYRKGFRVSDLEKKTATTSETLYSICSISKLFTSVAIMKLWEEGKLWLDDSISALLPSYNLKQQFSESVPITVRSLLTHSSGLPREADYPYWSDEFKFPTQKQVQEKLGQQQTLYPSSTYLQYSNLAMTLLGEIVTAISGMPYEKYIEENIL
jgi:CubicO group peptidase (beta-lactamase class C family)